MMEERRSDARQSRSEVPTNMNAATANGASTSQGVNVATNDASVLQQVLKAQQEQTQSLLETMKTMQEQQRKENEEIRKELKKTQEELREKNENDKRQAMMNESGSLKIVSQEPSEKKENKKTEQENPKVPMDPRERDPSKPIRDEIIRRLETVCQKRCHRQEYVDMMKTVVKDVENAIEKMQLENPKVMLFKASREGKLPTQRACQFFQVNRCQLRAVNGVHRHPNTSNSDIYAHVCQLCQEIRLGNFEHSIRNCEFLKEVQTLESKTPNYRPHFIMDVYCLYEDENLKPETENAEASVSQDD